MSNVTYQADRKAIARTRRLENRERVRDEADQIIRELGCGRRFTGISGTARRIYLTFDEARDLIRERSNG